VPLEPRRAKGWDCDHLPAEADGHPPVLREDGQQDVDDDRSDDAEAHEFCERVRAN